MNKLYIASTGSLCVDEKDNCFGIVSDVEKIDRVYLIKEELDIFVNLYDKQYTLHAVPGQILIKTYEKSFTHPVFLVDSKQWKENIEAYNEDIKKIIQSNQCCQSDACECR